MTTGTGVRAGSGMMEAGSEMKIAGGLQARYEVLLRRIQVYESVAVAFSGGVDSTFLTYAAGAALGRNNILCITARSVLFPKRELLATVAFCEEWDIRHEIVELDALGIDGFSSNPPDRCYQCKYELFSKFCAIAKKAGIDAVIEGSNIDDEGDYRPGMKAVAELGVKSPLREAGFTKDDVRLMSKALGLSTWDKPAYACLASRFAYGEQITDEKLGMVDKAEQFLLDKGFRGVRVRIHGNDHYIARIEALPEETGTLTEKPLCDEISVYFKGLGFTYVALDLAGYRTGSMNDALE